MASNQRPSGIQSEPVSIQVKRCAGGGIKTLNDRTVGPMQADLTSSACDCGCEMKINAVASIDGIDASTGRLHQKDRYAGQRVLCAGIASFIA